LREIKFRAWADKMMYQNVGVVRNLVILDCEYSDQLGEIHFKPMYYGLNDDSIVLMQFTGLHDKNGKEIYEGDIVKLNSVNLRIYYSESRALYRAEGSNKWHYDINEIMEFYNCEVIGNIYENPELIEQK
jgi:uncharacterized phage protein (TIGR01671 family)